MINLLTSYDQKDETCFDEIIKTLFNTGSISIKKNNIEIRVSKYNQININKYEL